MFKEPNLESKEKQTYPYDAVVVLGGGLQVTGHSPDEFNKPEEVVLTGHEKFAQTDFRHGDNAGTLGAGMRMVAAVQMYFDKKAKNFVFSTGISDPSRAKYGPPFGEENIPTEAKVYGDKFIKTITGLSDQGKRDTVSLESPQVFHEDKSKNTATNIVEVLRMIKEHGWQKVSIVTSNYHIPRTQALYQAALEHFKKDLPDVVIDFIPAEDYVRTSRPGEYDDVIEKYYDTEEMKKRMQNEQNGVNQIKEGTYKLDFSGVQL